MQSLLPLAVYCISLVSLQQPLALAAKQDPDSNRLDLLNKIFDQREDEASMSGSKTHIAVPSSAPVDPQNFCPAS